MEYLVQINGPPEKSKVREVYKEKPEDNGSDWIFIRVYKKEVDIRIVMKYFENIDIGKQYLGMRIYGPDKTIKTRNFSRIGEYEKIIKEGDIDYKTLELCFIKTRLEHVKEYLKEYGRPGYYFEQEFKDNFEKTLELDFE